MSLVNDFGAVHFLALIPLAWCGVSLLLARLSGWSLLAKRYRCDRDVSGESAAMRTGSLGVIQYHSCLSFRIGEEGLRMAVAFPLRLGHPPLLIPWSEIHHVRSDSRLYSHQVKVSIGRPTLVRATFPGWVRYRLPDSAERP